MKTPSFAAWAMALLLACTGCTAGTSDADNTDPDLKSTEQIDPDANIRPGDPDIPPDDNAPPPEMTPYPSDQQSPQQGDQQPAQKNRGMHRDSDSDDYRNDH